MRSVRVAIVLLVAALALVGCRGDEDTTATPPTTLQPGCGVTLAEVQALLPPTSGVTENSTPDARRCNFTWDEGGPRGIDVAVLRGGRPAFTMPAGYEPIAGYGDEAFVSATDRRGNAVAFVGNDVYAVDVVVDGTAEAAQLRDLALRLLQVALT
jgi:hypothetical protein